ncbi:hypothetical protein D9M68_803720 [compost metagenome]
MTIEALMQDLVQARSELYSPYATPFPGDHVFNLAQDVVQGSEREVEIPPHFVTPVTVHLEEYGCTVTGRLVYRHVHELGLKAVDLDPGRITVGPFILEIDRQVPDDFR